MAVPKADEDADLLTVKSKSALMRLPVARLRGFCDDHGLTVSSTGKTGPIKKDYVAAVWFHVSEHIGQHGKTTDISLHRIKHRQARMMTNRIHRRLSVPEKTSIDPSLSARRLTIWLKRSMNRRGLRKSPSHRKSSIHFGHKLLQHCLQFCAYNRSNKFDDRCST
jgi:hypothetical protein